MYQQPGETFVQSPDTVTPPEDTVYCFLDGGRVCGGDCVAFEPDKAFGTHCSVLGTMRFAAKLFHSKARPAPPPASEIPPPVVGGM